VYAVAAADVKVFRLSRHSFWPEQARKEVNAATAIHVTASVVSFELRARIPGGWGLLQQISPRFRKLRSVSFPLNLKVLSLRFTLAAELEYKKSEPINDSRPVDDASVPDKLHDDSTPSVGVGEIYDCRIL
jgi:hypothetical protein